METATASIPRIGPTLATLRVRANVRQREIAERLGLSQGHLSALETGKLRLPTQVPSAYIRELHSHLQEQLLEMQRVLAEIEALTSTRNEEVK